MLCVLQYVLVRIDYAEPDYPVEAGKNNDGWDKDRRDLVGKALDWRFRILCILNQFHYLIKRRIF